VTSSPASTGLGTWAWKPAWSARVRSTARVYAVSATAGSVRAGARQLADLADQLQSVDVGHADVRDDHVDRLRAHDLEGLGRAARGQHRGAALAEQLEQHLARVVLILDEQRPDPGEVTSRTSFAATSHSVRTSLACCRCITLARSRGSNPRGYALDVSDARSSSTIT
jgi:hypothetical protein